MRSPVARHLALAITLAAAATAAHGQQATTDNDDRQMDSNKIRLTIDGGTTLTATLADNPSAEALRALLDKGDITVRMEDYAGMEKVGPLGTSLPRSDRPTTTGPGDLILYQGRYFVIYYDTNSWDFTPLGKIDGASGTGMRKALGQGDVTVTLSAE